MLETRSLHDFNIQLLNGTIFELKHLKGKVILLSNVASNCGLQYQFDDYLHLHSLYLNHNFKIILTPDNSFLNQEPGTACEINNHYQNKEWPFIISQKISVRGNQQHPLYQWIDTQTGFMGKVRWNFYKFIFDQDGKLTAWFSSAKSPNSNSIIKVINMLLGKTI